MVRATKKTAETGRMLSVRQVKSGIGCTEPQLQNLRGLGLGKVGKISVLEDNKCTRGMIRKVSSLVVVGDFTNE